MRRLWIIFLILLTACSGQGDKPYTSDENLSIEQPVSGRLNDIQFAEKLHTPWSITKKNSIFYISERNGTIAMIDQQSGETSRLPIQFEKKLYTGGEGGCSDWS